jgi:tetratricopeptide (TPR) repeat protein
VPAPAYDPAEASFFLSTNKPLLPKVQSSKSDPPLPSPGLTDQGWKVNWEGDAAFSERLARSADMLNSLKDSLVIMTAADPALAVPAIVALAAANFLGFKGFFRTKAKKRDSRQSPLPSSSQGQKTSSRERQVAESPDTAIPPEALAPLYVQLGAQALEENRRYDAGLAYLYAACLEPKNPITAYLGLAKVNLSLGNYSVAYKACQQVQQLQHRGPERILAQALMQLLKREYDLALVEVNDYILRNHTDEYAFALLAYLQHTDRQPRYADPYAAQAPSEGAFELCFPWPETFQPLAGPSTRRPSQQNPGGAVFTGQSQELEQSLKRDTLAALGERAHQWFKKGVGTLDTYGPWAASILAGICVLHGGAFCGAAALFQLAPLTGETIDAMWEIRKEKDSHKRSVLLEEFQWKLRRDTPQFAQVIIPAVAPYLPSIWKHQNRHT